VADPAFLFSAMVKMAKLTYHQLTLIIYYANQENKLLLKWHFL